MSFVDKPSIWGKNQLSEVNLLGIETQTKHKVKCDKMITLGVKYFNPKNTHLTKNPSEYSRVGFKPTIHATQKQIPYTTLPR